MENKRIDPEVVKENFYKMPSYNPDSETISTEDIPTILKAVGYERTEEQFQAYRKWFDEIYNGKIPLDLAIVILDAADDMTKSIRNVITACDFDKSGFISENEYKACIHVLSLHFPNLPKVEYEVFLKEADRNEDGKASITEALDWIEARI